MKPSKDKVKAYLNVLIVAIPFSTVSGVPVRSWEPSRGAMFVACAQDTCELILNMKKSFYGL